MYLNKVADEHIAPVRLSRSTAFALLLLAVIALGTLVRTFHLLFAPIELPYHFGGLYVEFSHQITVNGFQLPERIPYYSEGGIPFAYPPLSFFVHAFLAKWLPLSSIELVNLLPPFVAALSVIAFYRLANAFRFSRRAALGALAFFAVLPPAYKELLYGDGLAESFGLLAVILFAAEFRSLAEQRALRSTVVVGILGGLCILASPGSAYGAAITGGLFSAFALSKAPAGDRLRTGLFLGVIALISAGTASPYLIFVAENHGINIFFHTLGDQYSDSLFRSLSIGQGALLAFRASEGGYFHWFWDALIFASLVFSLFRWREWLLPAWLMAFLLVPREGVWLASIPVALVAGRFLASEGLPFVKRAIDSTLFERSDFFLKVGVFSMLVYFAFHLVYLLLAHPGWGDVLRGSMVQDAVTSETVDALIWGRDNLPTNAQVLVIYDGNVEDWAPHFLRRTVVNMVYGTEWEPDERRAAQALNEALYNCADVGCVVHATRAHEIRTSAVYFFLSSAYFEKWIQSSDAALATMDVVFANDDAAFVQIHPQTF